MAAYLPKEIFVNAGFIWTILKHPNIILKKQITTSPAVYYCLEVYNGQAISPTTHLLPYQNPRAYEETYIKYVNPIEAPAKIAYLQVSLSASFMHY